MDFDAFRQDPKTIAAVERKLQVISEAAVRLGEQAEALCPGLPWRDVREIGNWLRHQYDREDSSDLSPSESAAKGRPSQHDQGDGRRPSPMSKSRKKGKTPKRVLALPDLERAKSAVLNTLTSTSGQPTYDHAIDAL